MNVLKFMQESVDYYNHCVLKPNYDWVQGLYALQAMYKDLQNVQQVSKPIIEMQTFADNEEFLRYAAWMLDDVCGQLTVDDKYFPPSTLFMALHEYEHKHGEGLNDEGLSSLQRIAVKRFAGEFVMGDAHKALMESVFALGEYLLKTDGGADSFAESLQLVDAMRLAIQQWMPTGFAFVDVTLRLKPVRL